MNLAKFDVYRWIDLVPRLANFYSELLSLLESLRYWVTPAGPEPRGLSLIELIDSHLRLVEQDAKDLKLETTAKRLVHIRRHIEKAKNDILRHADTRLVDEIRVLREALTDDLSERFIFVPPASIPPDEWWGQSALFGDLVYANFGSARTDISEAGNCYATDNNTACIFHLMRVAERGMRVLARDLKIHKNLKFPLEYADWGTVINSMNKKLSDIQKTKRGPKKDALLRFYSSAINKCEFLNNYWRTEVAHARRAYNELEAANAMRNVREFMQLLATRLKETPENK